MKQALKKKINVEKKLDPRKILQTIRKIIKINIGVTSNFIRYISKELLKIR